MTDIEHTLRKILKNQVALYKKLDDIERKLDGNKRTSMSFNNAKNELEKDREAIDKQDAGNGQY